MAICETGTSPATRPLRGDEYLESIRDGREIWLNGERVGDVTTHPGFRNSARSIARMYDALHDPAAAGTLLAPCDDIEGSTHPFFVAPRTTEQLVAGRAAIVAWQRMVYGFMGRSPDYKASFTATLGVHAEFYAPYEDNARRWYAESQRKVLYMNHAIVNPPVDRSLPPDEVGDVPIHVEEETDAGAVGSEFGRRHELYERNYLGNDEGVRLQTLLAAEMKGDADACRGFADQCMSEYDLDGWTIPGYVDPGDVSVIGRRA
jgi:aromatic ring hydroxylase